MNKRLQIYLASISISGDFIILNNLIKRVFDIFFSLLVIALILSWMVPVIFLLNIFFSKGPVFFAQKRTGYRNEIFTCYKFRTMIENLDANTIQAQKDDPRLTIIGKILRRTSLDELPQFLNVLIGNMSLVGPRPHMLHHTDYYSSQITNYMFRHSVRPGITGLAQIKGYRGETKELSLMKERVKLDIHYIENWSFWLDIKIIIITVFILIGGDKKAF
ncbi:sugar transferase [candidate division KSB1 bacterium]